MSRKAFHLITLVSLILLFILAGCGGGGGEEIIPGSAPRADHTTLDISVISQSALDAARDLSMSFSHASVGENIVSGLEDLRTSNSTRYSFPNWQDNNRGNPGWSAKISEFVTWVGAHNAEFDVFQMKFCYIDQDASFTDYRDAMLSLESTYPSKLFIWWTIPIMTSGSDNALRQSFNNQVRSYCADHNKPLFDIADIESHNSSGSLVTNGGNEAMATEWSSDGGHLNSDGWNRMARAMWWLMTQLAEQ